MSGTTPAETNLEIATVNAFLAALEELDVQRAISYLSNKVVYHNVSLPPARGIDTVAKQLRMLAHYGTGFEARTHRIAANGPFVLTERTDAIEVGDWRAEFWVCGTFEVVDGRIVLWRDYFDWAALIGASVRGGVHALTTALDRRLARTGSSG